MIATCDPNDSGSVVRYEKNVGNMEGFKKQGATVIALATEGDTTVPQYGGPHSLYSRSARTALADS